MDTIADPQLHLVDRLRSRKAEVGAAQLHLLSDIAECARSEVWRGSGHGTMTYWLSAELGITTWAAARYLKASEALGDLPRVSAALANGELGIEKVVELTRFATRSDERKLIAYAQHTTVGAIRKRADLATKRPLQDAQRADRERFLEWWWADDGNSLWIEGKLRADQGMVVTKALERVATKLPAEPVDELDRYQSQRMRSADALAALASQQLGKDLDTD